jgi:hypothetical protein
VKPFVKWLLGMPRSRWENDIRIGFRKRNCEDRERTELAEVDVR